MDFELDINGEIVIFDTFYPMQDTIHRALAQWNNISPDEPMVIKVKKIKSETETLGIHVIDETTIKEELS